MNQLDKCEQKNKIVIPKKGKIPDSISNEINKDCQKEEQEVVEAQIPYKSANDEYTKESLIYKKKYGGDDVGLLFGVSAGVICFIGFISCQIKKDRKEKGREVHFDHDEYVRVVDSEKA